MPFASSKRQRGRHAAGAGRGRPPLRPARHRRRRGSGVDQERLAQAQASGIQRTKAAAHQTGAHCHLEFALSACGQLVAPDAVFSHGQKRSGLWALSGPTHEGARPRRARAGGILPLAQSTKAAVTAEHVASAVLFFITRQTPTTGATIPVDAACPTRRTVVHAHPYPDFPFHAASPRRLASDLPSEFGPAAQPYELASLCSALGQNEPPSQD